MVEHPGGEADRRIRDAVERLRPLVHLERIAEPVHVEVGELVPGMLLVGRKVRAAAGRPEAPCGSLRASVADMLVWIASKPGGCCSAITSLIALPQSPPCAT